MTYKQYKVLRKELEKLKELIGIAYNKSNDISQLEEYDTESNFDLWYDVHRVTGNLWGIYCTIDNKIIELDKAIIQFNKEDHD